jgi:hypothetical protein
MRNSKKTRRMIVSLVLAVGLLVACGGPESIEPPVEVQPTTPPVEAPEEEEPTAPPTEIPSEDEPTELPTEVPQEEEPTQPPPTGDGAALLEERCTTCHSLERTTSVRKSRDEWEQTVIRMVSRGAELNAEEQEILIDYLAETYGP